MSWPSTRTRRAAPWLDPVRAALPALARSVVRSLGAALMLVLAAAPGCGGGDDDPMSCLEPLPMDCEPAFTPTFEAIYRNQISQKCGGSVCHGANGAMAGLVLEGEEIAYRHLLGEVDGRMRVLPGDAECSLLMRRLESKDPTFQMPPNNPLSERELCAFRHWIWNGAPRSDDE